MITIFFPEERVKKNEVSEVIVNFQFEIYVHTLLAAKFAQIFVFYLDSKWIWYRIIRRTNLRVNEFASFTMHFSILLHISLILN